MEYEELVEGESTRTVLAGEYVQLEGEWVELALGDKYKEWLHRRSSGGQYANKPVVGAVKAVEQGAEAVAKAVDTGGGDAPKAHINRPSAPKNTAGDLNELRDALGIARKAATKPRAFTSNDQGYRPRMSAVMKQRKEPISGFTFGELSDDGGFPKMLKIPGVGNAKGGTRPELPSDPAISESTEAPPWFDLDKAAEFFKQQVTKEPGLKPEKGAMAKLIMGNFKSTRDQWGYPEPNGETRYNDTIIRPGYKDADGNPVQMTTTEMHADIISRIMSDIQNCSPEDAAAGGPKHVLFSAGGPASGKTTSLNLPENADIKPKCYVNINGDDVKRMLPEYQKMVAGRDPFAAYGVHEESADITDKLIEAVQAAGMNYVMDGVGDHEPGWFAGSIQEAMDKGYTADVMYVYLPTDVAEQRATARAIEPTDYKGRPNVDQYRWVHPVPLRKGHRDSARRLKEVLALKGLRNLRVYDNTTSPPSLIAAEGPPGTEHEDKFQVVQGKEPSYDGLVAKEAEAIPGEEGWSDEHWSGE